MRFKKLELVVVLVVLNTDKQKIKKISKEKS